MILHVDSQLFFPEYMNSIPARQKKQDNAHAHLLPSDLNVPGKTTLTTPQNHKKRSAEMHSWLQLPHTQLYLTLAVTFVMYRWVYSVRDMILFLQFGAVVCSSLPDTQGWKQGLEESIGELAFLAHTILTASWAQKEAQSVQGAHINP